MPNALRVESEKTVFICPPLGKFWLIPWVTTGVWSESGGTK